MDINVQRQSSSNDWFSNDSNCLVRFLGLVAQSSCSVWLCYVKLLSQIAKSSCLIRLLSCILFGPILSVSFCQVLVCSVAFYQIYCFGLGLVALPAAVSLEFLGCIPSCLVAFCSVALNCAWWLFQLLCSLLFQVAFSVWSHISWLHFSRSHFFWSHFSGPMGTFLVAGLVFWARFSGSPSCCAQSHFSRCVF